MKFYNSLGPNPQVVRMFAAERGVELDMEDVDIMAGANRKAPYLDINPSGQMPCLVLDDGTAIAETIGLAAIVGAFAAGLVLDETHYRGYHELKAKKVEELLAPVSAIYVPVFFVLMGMRVDLSAFASASVLRFALVLSVAAIAENAVT